MNLLNNMKLEALILLKIKSTRIILFVILIVYILAFFQSYKTAVGLNNTILDSVKQIQSQTTSEEIDLSQSEELLRNVMQGLRPETGANYTLLLFAMLGPLAFSIIGSSLVGTEFSNRTAKVKAAHYGWSLSIVTKIMTLLAFIFLLTIISAVLGFIFSEITWAITLKNFEIAKTVTSPILVSSNLLRIIVASVGIAFYGLLGISITLITKSTLAGSISCIAITFIENNINVWWLPQSLYANLLVKNFNYFEGSLASIPPTISNASVESVWLFLTLWCLLLIVFSKQISKIQSL